MSDYSVSIVVPIFNTSQYLHQCISSVLQQTLSSVEIILVNDGSTDNSLEICEQYQKENSDKIKIINKENGGLTSAWKAGCMAASAEYIGFVDSDDTIVPNMFEKLYMRARKDGADIVCCGLLHVYEEESHKSWMEEPLYKEDYYEVSGNPDKFYSILINDGSFMGRGIQACRYTKLVKRELVIEQMPLCSNQISIGEDLQFTLCMFSAAEKISIVHDFYPYIYRTNSDSMTMKYDPDYLNKIILLKENLLRISEHYKRYDFYTQIINDFICLTILHIKGCIYKRPGLKYAEYIRDIDTIRSDPNVEEALKNYRMKRLNVSEKLFIFWLKYRFYHLIVLSIKIYFR